MKQKLLPVILISLIPPLFALLGFAYPWVLAYFEGRDGFTDVASGIFALYGGAIGLVVCLVALSMLLRDRP